MIRSNQHQFRFVCCILLGLSLLFMGCESQPIAEVTASPKNDYVSASQAELPQTSYVETLDIGQTDDTSTTSTADTCDVVPFTLYYERNPSVPLYLEGIAVTKETMHQIMNNSGWEKQLLQKSLVLPNEIRHDYLEINLDAVLEESCSYTIWGLFRPYSMYAFNNVFLLSGDKLSLYSPNEKDIFLTVEHSNGETRDYLAVLVFIA